MPSPMTADELFDALDTDGGGELSKEEVRFFVHTSCVPLPFIHTIYLLFRRWYRTAPNSTSRQRQPPPSLRSWTQTRCRTKAIGAAAPYFSRPTTTPLG